MLNKIAPSESHLLHLQFANSNKKGNHLPKDDCDGFTKKLYWTTVCTYLRILRENLIYMHFFFCSDF